MMNTNNNLMSGNEYFYDGETKKDFTVQDFWRFQFSNLWDMQGECGEFVVSMALGNKMPDNKCGWTQYDISYRGKRIEVKTTAYYQPWRERWEKYKDSEQKVSAQRTFSIRMAHENEGDNNSLLVRNNDVYVFALINGETRELSDPRQLENWRFWVVPTDVINKVCGKNKSVGLNKVKKICSEKDWGEKGLSFGEVKTIVDACIDGNW